MNLTIKQYSEIKKEDWDNFVYANSLGYAYHLYDIVAMDWDTNNENLSFAIVNPDTNDIYMLIQLHKISCPFKTALQSRWGYVLKDNLPKKTFNSVKNCFTNYIDELIKKHDIKRFKANIPPLTDKTRPDKCEMVNPLIYFNFAPHIRYTAIVDLSKPDDKILADCEETTRREIRNVGKLNKYEIVESNGSETDCKTYIDLHRETYSRTHNANHILDNSYVENIFYKLIPQKICRVFFLKNTKTQEIIASVAILLYKDTAYYWWGSSKNVKDIGINKYLLFNVMCIIKKDFNDSGYFETGAVHIWKRDGKTKGLTDFKKCFGTFLHPIYEGEYEKPQVTKHLNLLGIKITYKKLK